MKSRICTLCILISFTLGGVLFAQSPQPELTNPAAWTEQAPGVFHANFETSKGMIVIEVHRDWAPEGADRFYNLVRSGYFNDTRFFRIVKNFIVQWGMSGDPAVNQAWRAAAIPADPVRMSNEIGMVTFAQGGNPNTRTTQVFINLKDNTRLDGMNFSPFGKVVEGMDIVKALYSGYGEGAPSGRGPSQGMIAQRGNDYLRERFPKLDFVINATAVPVTSEKAADAKDGESSSESEAGK